MQNRLRKRQNGFLGKEEIFRKEVGLKVEYGYDKRVVNKFRRIRDSGIAEEWLNISFRTVQPSVIYPNKLNLHENMVVQFCVLGIGCSLAMSGFLIEARKLVFRFLKLCVQCSKRLLERGRELAGKSTLLILHILHKRFCLQRPKQVTSFIVVKSQT